MPGLFPIFLKLTARPCLVVGAGSIAEGKIFSMVEAEAQVTVVATRASERVQQLASDGAIQLHLRPYQTEDMQGIFLAVAGTDIPEVNRKVFADAQENNVLVNAVDDPPYCDYYFPSVVRRGDLQIAISTAGESPALAQQLRKDLNEQLPLDLGPWLMELGRLRREVLQMEPLGEPRKLILHQLATREVCGAEACPSRQIARAHARAHYPERNGGGPDQALAGHDHPSAQARQDTPDHNGKSPEVAFGGGGLQPAHASLANAAALSAEGNRT